MVLLSLYAEAQVKTKHQANYDAKPLRFGYYVGFGTTHYNVKFLPSFSTPVNLQDPNGATLAVTSPNTTSIRAGAMVNYYINEYFDVRFSPLNISVLERKITYLDGTGTEKDDQTFSKSWMEIPFHVKYKSERRENSRMYVFAGTRWGFETNIINRKGNRRTTNTSMRTNDLTLEYGVGLEFFREYFKVTPELHFSHGLFNMVRKNDDRHHLEHVRNLKTHTVSLLILFQ